MIYIETGSTDVYYNFGLEHYFATEKRLPDTVFLFWRTTPTLMVGKYQNILEEINKPYADAHGIHLVRRMSGGGTIYTDLGGWQFTFIEHSPDQQIEFARIFSGGTFVDHCLPLQCQIALVDYAQKRKRICTTGLPKDFRRVVRSHKVQSLALCIFPCSPVVSRHFKRHVKRACLNLVHRSRCGIGKPRVSGTDEHGYAEQHRKQAQYQCSFCRNAICHCFFLSFS